MENKTGNPGLNLLWRVYAVPVLVFLSGVLLYSLLEKPELILSGAFGVLASAFFIRIFISRSLYVYKVEETGNEVRIYAINPFFRRLEFTLVRGTCKVSPLQQDSLIQYPSLGIYFVKEEKKINFKIWGSEEADQMENLHQRFAE